MSNLEKMIDTLPIMAKGMLGIFVVTGIIVLSIFLLNKLTTLSLKKKDDSAE